MKMKLNVSLALLLVRMGLAMGLSWVADPSWMLLVPVLGMAYAITNKTDFTPQGFPTKIVELADLTADVAAQDLGIVGFKWLRVRGRIKALVGTFALVVKVDTVVGMSSPETIIQTPTYPDVEPITFEYFGWSDDGFQFVNLDFTFGTSGTVDVELAAW
jgi:hypothetical protein